MSPSWHDTFQEITAQWRDGRRWKAPGTIAVATLVVLGGGLGVAMAAGESSTQSISCPTVADKLPTIPARAKAEVDRNLALLETQIDEANARLVSSAGEGGPNFVQNAIVGPLASKRGATIDRIAISIGRAGERPTGLESLATCTVSGTAAPEEEAPAEEDPAEEAPADEAPADEAADGGAAAGSIVCPTVADQLPDIPAQAQAEVERNLALLETQIDEASTRLANSVGEGGPNFVQNAIIGPLEDKRVATINRIATAIGRNADRPAGLDSLAPCEVNEDAAAGDGEAADGGEAAAGDEAAGGGEAAAGAEVVDLVVNDANDGGSDGAISCPTVADQLPGIPAGALAEVERNLGQLETQIDEANTRLANSVGEGGPNFVQNAIIGPLEDKRVAAINRIATAIGRIAAERPAGLDALAPCEVAE